MSQTKRAKKIVAVDWDTRTLRLVYAHMLKRGVKIIKRAAVRIPEDVQPYDTAQMGQFIRESLSKEKISARHAVADIPREHAILNTLNLPKVGREELPGMVQIQIAKELPFPLQDAVVDFAIDPRPTDGPTQDVLVAAVQNEVVERYRAVFEAAGLRLDRIGLRPYANMVAATRLLEPAMPERVLFIDVRPTLAEIDVLRDGHIVFSRAASVSVPEGVSDRPTLSFRSTEGTDSEDGPGFHTLGSVVDALLIDITRSIEAYRTSDPVMTKFDLAVVAGDTGVEEALCEALSKRLKIESQVYDPSSSFGWEPSEGADASAFAAPLGLILSQVDGDGVHFDFLHPKKEVSVTREKLRKAPIFAATIALFVLAGVTAVWGVTRDDRVRIAQLNSAILALEKREDVNKSFMKVMTTVREFDADQLIWVDALHDLIDTLPSNQELVLEKVQLDQDERRITLYTRTKDRTTAAQARDKLKAHVRDGDAEPRFWRVDVGAQRESPSDTYPFSQNIEVFVKLNVKKKEADAAAPGAGKREVQPSESKETPSEDARQRPQGNAGDEDAQEEPQ